MYAAEFGQQQTVRVLLAAGSDVTLRDKDGETALMTAQRRGRANIVQSLQAADKYPLPSPTATRSGHCPQLAPPCRASRGRSLHYS
jgi:ankyrin repeat protein